MIQLLACLGIVWLVLLVDVHVVSRLRAWRRRRARARDRARSTWQRLVETPMSDAKAFDEALRAYKRNDRRAFPDRERRLSPRARRGRGRRAQ